MGRSMSVMGQSCCSAAIVHPLLSCCLLLPLSHLHRWMAPPSHRRRISYQFLRSQTTRFICLCGRRPIGRTARMGEFIESFWDGGRGDVDDKLVSVLPKDCDIARELLCPLIRGGVCSMRSGA